MFFLKTICSLNQSFSIYSMDLSESLSFQKQLEPIQLIIKTESFFPLYIESKSLTTIGIKFNHSGIL
jgi:hypothetical protein